MGHNGTIGGTLGGWVTMALAVGTMGGRVTMALAVGTMGGWVTMALAVGTMGGRVTKCFLGINDVIIMISVLVVRCNHRNTMKGKVFHGQEPPSRESTTTECGVNYQQLSVMY